LPLLSDDSTLRATQGVPAITGVTVMRLTLS